MFAASFFEETLATYLAGNVEGKDNFIAAFLFRISLLASASLLLLQSQIDKIFEVMVSRGLVYLRAFFQHNRW